MRKARRQLFRPRQVLALTGMALLCGVGCDIETLRIQVCPGSLAVLVTRTPDAEFTWMGGCGVGALEVREVGAYGQVVWRIQDRQATNRLVAPIRYGTAPLESNVLLPPAPLEPGRQYLVEVKGLYRIQGRVVASSLGSGRFAGR